MRLALATFAGREGERFTAGDLELELVACEPSPFAGPGREAFSLIFHADRHLPQQIFSMQHRDLGAFDLFLVPLGPEGEAMVYEAVVNAAP